MKNMLKLSTILLPFAMCSHPALAMDLHSSSMQSQPSGSDSASSSATNFVNNNTSSFASSHYPASGWFVQLHYGMNKAHLGNTAFLLNKQFPTSIQTAKYTNDSPSQNTMGAGFGYEDSDIQNSILKFLQIKRFSLSIDYYRDGQFDANGKTYGSDNYNYYNYDIKTKPTNRIMLNTKLNIFKIWHLSPYIQGGVGMGQYQANYHITSTNVSSVTAQDNVKQTKFVYQFGAGIDWFIASGLSLGVGYQYTDAGSMQFSNKQLVPSQAANNIEPLKINLKNSGINVNLSYTF